MGGVPQTPSHHSLLLCLPQPWRVWAESQTRFCPQSNIQGQPRSVKAHPAQVQALLSRVQLNLLPGDSRGAPLPSHGKVRSSPLLNLEQEINDGFKRRINRVGEGPIPIPGPFPGSAKREGQAGTCPDSPALSRGTSAQLQEVHKVQTPPQEYKKTFLARLQLHRV